MSFKKGDQVWWNDPDDGILSGEYTIADIDEDDAITIERYNKDGEIVSCATVFEHELEEI